MNLTVALRNEYDRLWRTMHVQKIAAADKIADRIVANRARYAAVEKTSGVPWFITAVIHSLEGSGSFTTHLHNGDPLTRRTTRVPKGRPVAGSPPFTWEESAADALKYDGLTSWRDWTVAGILFKLEGFNGWGYRLHHKTVLTPYLWSFSNHYAKGKYVADGKWDGSAVSAQCGAAVLLRRLADRDIIQLGGCTP